MSQVNRTIRGNPDLDKVDHALGRPFDPGNTYRNYFATSTPEEIAKFSESDWWMFGAQQGDMAYFHVTDAGRQALREELAKSHVYGRLYVLSCPRWTGEVLAFAKSRSAAKYRAYLDADLDWPFMEFCEDIRVRLASPNPERTE